VTTPISGTVCITSPVNPTQKHEQLAFRDKHNLKHRRARNNEDLTTTEILVSSCEFIVNVSVEHVPERQSQNNDALTKYVKHDHAKS